MRPDEEPVLIARFKAGEEAALEQIISTYKGALYGYIYRFVNDASEAEDILSLTFVKAWNGRDRYEPRARFQTWLYTIAGNLCRDHARKQKRHPADFAAKWTEFDEAATPDLRVGPAAENPAENAARREDATALRHAIDELPHDLKTALVLFSLEGYSQEEAALRAGCTSKAIETRVYRAKKRLRGRLKFLAP